MRSSLGWLLFGLAVAAPARAQGVPATTAKVAADAGKYDIVGFKIGMPKMKAWGVGVPNLVSYLTLMIGSGPLDRCATNATHRYATKSSRITAPSGRGSATASKPQP